MTTEKQDLSKPITRADQLAAFARKTGEPDAMQQIFRHLANGGHLFDLLDLWGCAYSDVLAWIVEDDARRNLYNSAMQTQGEYVKREVLDTLRKIARFDIRTLYYENGALKHPTTWPPEAAFAVAGVETEDLFEWTGEKGDKSRELIGYAKKVKLRDNLRAFEMIGKNLALFIERHEHTHKHTLEALVMAALGPAAPERPIISLPPEKNNRPIETGPGFSDSRAQGITSTNEPQISRKGETDLPGKEASPEKESEKNFPEKIGETEKGKSEGDSHRNEKSAEDELPI